MGMNNLSIHWLRAHCIRNFDAFRLQSNGKPFWEPYIYLGDVNKLDCFKITVESNLGGNRFSDRSYLYKYSCIFVFFGENKELYTVIDIVENHLL